MVWSPRSFILIPCILTYVTITLTVPKNCLIAVKVMCKFRSYIVCWRLLDVCYRPYCCTCCGTIIQRLTSHVSSVCDYQSSRNITAVQHSRPQWRTSLAQLICGLTTCDRSVWVRPSQMDTVASSMNTYSQCSYILISMHINIPVADMIQKAWQELFCVIYPCTSIFFVRMSFLSVDLWSVRQMAPLYTTIVILRLLWFAFPECLYRGVGIIEWWLVKHRIIFSSRFGVCNY